MGKWPFAENGGRDESAWLWNHGTGGGGSCSFHAPVAAALLHWVVLDWLYIIYSIYKRGKQSCVVQCVLLLSTFVILYNHKLNLHFIDYIYFLAKRSYYV